MKACLGKNLKISLPKAYQNKDKSKTRVVKGVPTEFTNDEFKQVHVSNFGGMAGSEDFACATLPTTPLDFQGKIKNFCHPTLLKVRFKISVTPSPPQTRAKGQSQYHGASINSNGLLTLSGLLSLKFLLHMTTSFTQREPF